MVDGAAFHFHDKSTVSPVTVRQHAGSPMLGRCKSEIDPQELQGVPPLHLVNLLKTEVMNEVFDSTRNNDGLVCCDLSETRPVQMVEVGVGNEHEIDIGKMIAVKTRIAKSFKDGEPVGPVRVDEDVCLGRLNQKGRMPNPGDADLFAQKFWENRGGYYPGSASGGKEGGNNNFGNKITLCPTWPFHDTLYKLKEVQQKAKSMTEDPKQEAREMVRERLKALSNRTKEAASLAMTAYVLQQPEWSKANTMLMFSSLRSEPNIAPLMAELRQRGGKVVLPATTWTPGELALYVVEDNQTLVRGKFGFLEPDPALCQRVELSSIQLMLTPGVAFDRRCHRLGRGGGYYDRLLEAANKSCPVMGLMFSCQELDFIPMESHDRPLDAVCTEKEVIRLPEQ